MTFFPSIYLICSTYSISGPNDSRDIRVQFPSRFCDLPHKSYCGLLNFFQPFVLFRQ